MLAIRETLGEIVGADLLIDAALRALLDGVDSQPVTQLAGLGRSEEAEAHDLFRAVVDELDLKPRLPSDPRLARWELVRWWCRTIVDGELTPAVAGGLILAGVLEETRLPRQPATIVGWVSEWEDWTPSWEAERDDYGQLIIAEAETLLAGHWAPE